ncbi:tyrosine-type recombinase/integrase [Homoserinimonas sp. A447]
MVTAQGQSELEAEDALLTKLNTWVPPKKRRAEKVGPDGEILGPEVDVDIEESVASTTLGEATRLWLAEVSADTDRKRQTRDYWRRVARQTVLKDEKLASTALSDVTAGQLNRYLNKVKMKTPSQAKKAKMLVRQVLEAAVLDNAVPYNVAHNIPKPRRKARAERREKVKALTLGQYYEFADALERWVEEPKKHRKGGAPRDASYLVRDDTAVFAGTGLRHNEALGLRPQDVDLQSEPPTITVRGTLVEIRGYPIAYQEEPKTAAGERVITIPATVAAALRRQMEINQSPDFVFTTGPEKPVSESHITRTYRKVRPEHLDFLTPQTFRRSVATWLKQADSTAAATAQLGHEDESTTEEFYIQQQEERVGRQFGDLGRHPQRHRARGLSGDQNGDRPKTEQKPW